MIPYLAYLPIKKFSQLRKAAIKLKAVADHLIKIKTDDYLKGLEGGKDLMTLLVRANANEEKAAQLSEVEVRAEIA